MWDTPRAIWALTFTDRPWFMEQVGTTAHGLAQPIIPVHAPGASVCTIHLGRVGACQSATQPALGVSASADLFMPMAVAGLDPQCIIRTITILPVIMDRAEGTTVHVRQARPIVQPTKVLSRTTATVRVKICTTARGRTVASAQV